MAIPTSRTHEAARLQFFPELCNGCGLCVQVCKDFGIRIVDGKAERTEHSVFGCIGCGHCMAICPNEAVKVEGRCLSAADLTVLPGRSEVAGYESFKNLLQRRRAIREFLDREVEPQVIDQVLEAVRLAPMGLPPSDVHVFMLDSRAKVRKFSVDFCAYLEGCKWLVSNWFLALMRPFWQGRAMRCSATSSGRSWEHIPQPWPGAKIWLPMTPRRPLFLRQSLLRRGDTHHCGDLCDVGGRILSLGTCIVGGMHPFIQNGPAARKFREKQGIRYASREGLMVIMGYPSVKYRKGIRRSLAAVDRYDGA